MVKPILRSPVKVVRMPIWIERFGIDHAVPDCVIEHRAMIDPPAVIGLDIAMRIEMDESQGTVLLGMRLEQRDKSRNDRRRKASISAPLSR